MIGMVALLLFGCHSMPSANDAPANQKERYRRATKKLKRARSEEDRWLALGDAAKAAVWAGHDEEARIHAEELRFLTPKYKESWNYGNAVHDFNLVLGSVALRLGDVDGAKQFLLASGRTPGSPQLDSFGPNMNLAKELLVVGEKQTVIRYFELCEKFWPGVQLSNWKEEVKAGKIPDFGANLVY